MPEQSEVLDAGDAARLLGVDVLGRLTARGDLRPGATPLATAGSPAKRLGAGRPGRRPGRRSRAQ